MAAVLVVLFLVVPVVEIYVIVQVGQEIGVLPTVGLLVVESLIGAWVVKREGRRAWLALKGAIGRGRVPSGELADAALVLVGGTLLLTPGFVTDVFGFFLVLPLTRPLARRLLAVVAARRPSSAARAPLAAPWSGARCCGTTTRRRAARRSCAADVRSWPAAPRRAAARDARRGGPRAP